MSWRSNRIASLIRVRLTGDWPHPAEAWDTVSVVTRGPRAYEEDLNPVAGRIHREASEPRVSRIAVCQGRRAA